MSNIRSNVFLFTATLFIGVVFLLFSKLSFELGSEIYMSYQSEHWPSTNGLILNLRIEHCGRGGLSYSGSISYGYLVENHSYVSSRAIFGDGYCGSYDGALGTLNRFIGEGTLKVFFDPKNPSNAVLIPGKTEYGTYFLFLLTIFGLGVMGYCLFWIIMTLINL